MSVAQEGVPPSDEAVSPVVGMIMILAISIAGLAAVLSWGLPAIEEMRSNVQLQGGVKQFEALDAEIKALVAGQAAKTTPKWQPSLSGGTVHLSSDAVRWVVTVDVAAGHNFTFYGLNDTTTNAFRLYNHGSAVTNLNVSAYVLVGSERRSLNVSTSSGSGAQMDAATTSLGVGSDIELWVWNATGVAVNFARVTLEFTVKEESGSTTTLGRAFMVDTGEFVYVTATGYATKLIVQNNGMVLAGREDDLRPMTEPLIPAPRTFKNSDGTESRSLFIRVVTLNGSASWSGDQPVDVLLNLYGTYSRADDANVSGVRITVYGDRQDPWHDFLADPYGTYRFTKVTDTWSGRSVASVYHREGALPFQFRLLHSIVTVSTP